MSEIRPPDGSHAQDEPFVVVGLGASAGGLEALDAFFSGLPTTDSCAFVVVVHLSPDHESEMAEILGRTVPVPVVQVSERVRVEKGHVYVIPPNRNLHIEDSHLQLTPLESERSERRPIDYFFRTLAGAWGRHAVAVVLSGTGDDGTVGVRAVKEAGGFILAQEPADAQYDDMPRSAIASGVVDTVGTAAELAAATIRYSDRLKHARLPTDEPGALAPDDVRAVQRVLSQLHVRTGHDFARYKRSTVLRRLERRLHVVGADTLNDYADLLQADGDEARNFLKDLLISVTNFFRDVGPFAVLEAEVVPKLFEGKGPDDAVRVWTAGCATGEEAYSVAILLAEHAATIAEPPVVQVFGTDLSESAVRVAREGVYPESIEDDVSPERLARFFRHEPRGYRVTERLRETVVFAPHSLLNDPPFSNVDLVTCRNVLIYFQRALQQQALELFHYALNPRGYLFLGTSETAEAVPDAYVAVDKANRVYQRGEGGTTAAALALARGVRGRAALGVAARGAQRGAPSEPDSAASFAEVHQRLRAGAAPPSVLVAENDEVVHVSAGAGAFLEVADGEPTRLVLQLVRPELRVAVQLALFQASRQTEAVVTGPTRLDVGGAPHDVRTRVQAAAERGLFQVLFDAVPLPPGEGSEEGASDDARVATLTAEHRLMQEQLQVSIEGFETNREELQAQNEELQSINEELRSTAEELETSKVESQTIADELLKVNDELKASVGDLAQARDDLENLIVSTEIATLFLDRDLCIKWFTPQVRSLFHVRTSDVGRPLADLAPKFGDAHLVEDAEAVLDRLQVAEREVESKDGRRHLVHVRPYRSATDHIDGVVITFVDITERYRQQEALRESEERCRGIVDQEIVGVVFLDLDRRVISANARFCELTGCDEATLAGTPMETLTHPDDVAENVELFGRMRADGAPFTVEKRYARPDGTTVWVSETAAVVRGADGQPQSTVALAVDVTELTRAGAALRESEERYRTLFTTIDEGFALCEMVVDDDGQPLDYRFLDVNPAFATMSGISADVVGRTARELVPGLEDHWVETFARVALGREPARFENRAEPLGRWFDVYATPVGDAALRRFAVVFTDVTARKVAEHEIRDLNASLESRVEERTAEVQRLATRLTVAEQEERQRIAHILHDDLQQQLYGLSTVLSLLAREPLSGAASALATRATGIAGGAADMARSLATELSPAILQADRLQDVLEWVASAKHAKYGLEIEVEVRDDPHVADPALRVLLYQLVRELVFNVVKHSGATRAHLAAWTDGDYVVVQVGDDGAGFDVESVEESRPDGFGLTSVRERLRLIGGRSEIDSAPGRGTRVTLFVPSGDPVPG